jgi:hypothetical protein
VPDEAGAATETRQVDERDHRAFFEARLDPAGLAERSGAPALDVDTKLAVGLVVYSEHEDIRQADQKFTDARRLRFHRDSPI